MASAEIKMNVKAPPALAVTYEGDDTALLVRVVPLIDVLISP